MSTTVTLTWGAGKEGTVGEGVFDTRGTHSLGTTGVLVISIGLAVRAKRFLRSLGLGVGRECEDVRGSVKDGC